MMLTLTKPSLSSILLAGVAATALFAANNAADALSLSPNEGTPSRRDVLIGGSAAAAAAVGSPFPSWAAAAAGNNKNNNNNNGPIAVVGASGRTGALCVASCLRRGLPVKALTRSGSWPPPKIDLNAVGYNGDAASSSSNPLLTISACDVRDARALTANLAGCRAVIYAASASKSGGNSKEIDGDGVVFAGESCLENGVGRYVVLSSGSTTRPASLGFRFTEMAVAGIMTQKRLGEVGVANSYAANDGAGKSSSSSTYTIVRPGGLDEPKQNIIQGPSALEITQGDVLAGFISRADVAEVAVETALSSAANLRNTAFELYYRNKVVPVDKKYRKYSVNPDNNGVVERLHGDTYEGLFKGVVPNYDYLVDA